MQPRKSERGGGQGRFVAAMDLRKLAMVAAVLCLPLLPLLPVLLFLGLLLLPFLAPAGFLGCLGWFIYKSFITTPARNRNADRVISKHDESEHGELGVESDYSIPKHITTSTIGGKESQPHLLVSTEFRGKKSEESKETASTDRIPELKPEAVPSARGTQSTTHTPEDALPVEKETLFKGDKLRGLQSRSELIESTSASNGQTSSAEPQKEVNMVVGEDSAQMKEGELTVTERFPIPIEIQSGEPFIRREALVSDPSQGDDTSMREREDPVTKPELVSAITPGVEKESGEIESVIEPLGDSDAPVKHEGENLPPGNEIPSTLTSSGEIAASTDEQHPEPQEVSAISDSQIHADFHAEQSFLPKLDQAVPVMLSTQEEVMEAASELATTLPPSQHAKGTEERIGSAPNTDEATDAPLLVSHSEKEDIPEPGYSLLSVAPADPDAKYSTVAAVAAPLPITETKSSSTSSFPASFPGVDSTLITGDEEIEMPASALSSEIGERKTTDGQADKRQSSKLITGSDPSAGSGTDNNRFEADNRRREGRK